MVGFRIHLNSVVSKVDGAISNRINLYPLVDNAIGFVKTYPLGH